MKIWVSDDKFHSASWKSRIVNYISVHLLNKNLLKESLYSF